MIGVYFLAQLCSVATFWFLYLLSRSIVGSQQAVLAVLLTMTVTAFSSPSLEFGPLVLARPLWALLLFHSWQLIGQKRRNVWFAWSIEAGLLLLTTSAAIGLLLLVAGFTVATERGRRTLMSFDPLFALLVIVVLVLPYLVWLIRADALAMPPWPGLAEFSARATALGMAARRSGRWQCLHRTPRGAEQPTVQPLAGGSADHLSAAGRALARDFVYFFAIAPALAGSLISGLFDLDRVVGGAGLVLMMSGLAAIVVAGDLVHIRRQRLLRTVWAAAIVAPALSAVAATLFLPWTGSNEVATSLPSRSIAQFFGDSFERRTNQRLRAVAGDAQIASLVALDPRTSASVSRCNAATDALGDAGEIQRDRRRRGVACVRHRGHAAARDRPALSGARARSAARLRMAGERPPAAVADRLGHRAAEGAIAFSSFRGDASASNPESRDSQMRNCASAVWCLRTIPE